MAEYSPAERRVLELLGEAYNTFAALPRQHPTELPEFVTSIHACQVQVMARLAQRADVSGLTPVIEVAMPSSTDRCARCGLTRAEVRAGRGRHEGIRPCTRIPRTAIVPRHDWKGRHAA